VTVVLDAFAVIAALVGEPAAAEVEHQLRGVNPDLRIATTNLAEVVDQLVRQAGLAAAEVDNAIESLIAAGLRLEPLDAPTGQRAGHLRAQFYHRRTSAISLADCIALATALRLRAALATADPALAAAARRAGAELLALPDSQGRRP
jgi:PIN domain nuclease of toxin-antitoxin system